VTPPWIDGVKPQDLALYPVAEAPAPRTLVEIFRATAVEHPEAVALDNGTAVLSYAEFERLVEDQAARLNSAGIGPGDRVGIRVPSGTADLYIAILGTILAGAAYVPVDWDDPDERASTVWEEAGVAAVFGAELELDLHRSPQAAIPAPELPGLEDTAWIIFTSGSTGKPKGVAISHRSAAALVDAERVLYLPNAPLEPGDRVMAGLSVAFDASCEEMWLAWRSGAALVPAPRSVVRSAVDLGDWILRSRVTAVSTVPTLASLWSLESLTNVRLLIFGGEACPLSLAERLATPGREVWNTYGPTEATVIATGALLSGKPPVRIGLPLTGWRLAVVDEDENPVLWGEEGQLIIGGVGLGRYIDPEKDAEKYAPMSSLGWERAYRSGDLVRADPEGIVFVGRADDQVKISGQRIELSGIDEELTHIPGVRAGASAVHATDGGNQVLVCYVTELEIGTLDVGETRQAIAATLPGHLMPTVVVLPELPMKTSGKVDRAALPWPVDTGQDRHFDDPELTRLADLWTQQLGPVPMTEDTDFFDIGGSSMALAKLVSVIRRDHPEAEIGEMYRNTTLSGMRDYLSTLRSTKTAKPDVADRPWWNGPVQALFVGGLYVISGARYAVGAVIVVWFLATFLEATWVPTPPLVPLVLAWLCLFSLPGRMVFTSLAVRCLMLRFRPGTYRRGSWQHIRLWMAERLVEFNKFETLQGTPTMPLFFRMLGNRVGRDTHLNTMPPVSGLLTVGDRSVLEYEVDVAGHWIDGDRLMVGPVTLGDDVRIGARSFVEGGVVLDQGSEVSAGAFVGADVPAETLVAGVPAEYVSPAGQTWPQQSPSHTGYSLGIRAAYSAGEIWMGMILFVAMIPAALLVFSQIQGHEHFSDIVPIMATWVPVFVILTSILWLALVVLSVRLAATLIRPGYFSLYGREMWAVWFTETILAKTRVSSYPVYASSFTPFFMRLMGANVGRNVEISTVEVIPHLTTFAAGSFAADHTMIGNPRRGRGWLHVGEAVVGPRAFVGNSAIISADHRSPASSLIAVLSNSRGDAEAGSTWLGRTPEPIARSVTEGDDENTYLPSRTLQLMRSSVELLRIVPMMITAWVDLVIVAIFNEIYMSRLGNAGELGAFLAVLLWSPIVVLGAGIFSALVPVAVKWAIVGRFTAGSRALFSTFVWRNELMDVFVESLAVPGIIRFAIGSPLFNMWARLMGTKLDHGVWCETWWLPEFDLISCGRNATINRGTVLQTHLFHDRIMQMAEVRLEDGATLGPSSFILPGAALGQRTTVGPGSLVMLHERLPEDSNWVGNPVRHVADLEFTRP
jgi:non-ribosomal peptide synthetase-like protein